MRAKCTIVSLLLFALTLTVSALPLDPGVPSTEASEKGASKDSVTEKPTENQTEVPKGTETGKTEESPSAGADTSGVPPDSATEKPTGNTETGKTGESPGDTTKASSDTATDKPSEITVTGKTETSPSGDTDKSEVSSDSTTDKPSENTDTSEKPNDGIGKGESSTISENRKPEDHANVTESSPDTTTGNPSEKPNENTGAVETEKPSGNTETEKPSENTKTEKPSENTETEKAIGNTETEKPSGNTETEKPSGNTETEKPSGNTETEKPSGNTETEKPSENTETKKPSENTETEKPTEKTAVDCSDIRASSGGDIMNGVYKIQPDGMNQPIDVFCDMKTDGGGWTVIQKRGNYPGFKVDDFVKNWDDYKKGFGNLKKEYWLGNDNLYALTNQNSYILRVDLEDVDGSKAYAIYSDFMVGNEDSGYQLSLGGCSGDANDALSYHNKMKFSTIDKDNDQNPSGSCAQSFHGGWWYNNCHHANLNGLNLQGNNAKENEGITWYEWRGGTDSLAFVQMKIKPRDM